MMSATGSALRRRGLASAGYSLLEMIIVLAVIGLFTGMVVVGFGSSEPEKQLVAAANDIRGAAHKASHLALVYRRDFFVIFDKEAFWVSETDVREGGRPSSPDTEQISRYFIPDGVTTEIRVGNEESWKKPSGYSWRFRGSGLCDLVKVRLSYDRSFIELDFNVLTARAEEMSYFQ